MGIPMRTQNMNRTALILACLLAAVAVPAQASARDGIEGTWKNRPNTLVVRIAPCGNALCGTVIEAAEDAKESVRKAGTSNLVGTLPGCRSLCARRWAGPARAAH